MMKPTLEAGVARIVAAGMKLMYAPQFSKQLNAGLDAEQPMPIKLAAQVAGLLKLLDQNQGGKIPKKLMIPAAVMLIQDLANFLVETDGVKISDNDIVQAQQMAGKILIAEYRAMEQQRAASQPGRPQQPQGMIGAAQ